MARLHALSALIVVLAALVVPGCSATIDGACNKCPKESASCVSDLTETQTLAASKGCDAEFQDALDCADSKGVCDGSGALSASDVCAAEIVALSACTGK